MNTSESPYKRPFIYAVFIHVILFVFLFWQFAPKRDFASRMVQPDVDIIKAVAVSQQSLDAVKAEKLKKQQEAERVKAELKRRQLEKERAVKKAEEERIAKAKALELQKKQEAERKLAEAKAAELKKKQEAERKLAEAKAAEKVAQEKAAKIAAQQKAAKELEQAQEQALQDQIAQEQHAIEAARSNARQSEVERYLALIQQALENNWNKPANLDPSIYSLLHVQIGPGGVVINVSIAKSSGNPALDSSARAAVFKASPLPVPDDPDLFNAFRQITLKAGAENMSGV
jgi:colicin import membrane protein